LKKENVRNSLFLLRYNKHYNEINGRKMTAGQISTPYTYVTNFECVLLK